MPVILKNNASSTLATAITASDTAIAVADGSQFPALSAGEYFYATLVSPAGTTEIIKVTARVSNSLTVVRAQDGSSAASFQVGTLVEMRVAVASVIDAAISAVSLTDLGVTASASELNQLDGNIFTSNASFSPTKQIAFTGRSDGSGSIDQLLKLSAGDIYGRPSVSYYDAAARHRVSAAFHERNGTSAAPGDYHDAYEIKTSADPAGASPSVMFTRFSVGTDADLADVTVNCADNFYVRDGSSTTFAVNTDSGDVTLGDGTNEEVKIDIAGSRSAIGYDLSGGNTVVQGGSGKGISFCTDNATFASGEVWSIAADGVLTGSDTLTGAVAYFGQDNVAREFGISGMRALFGYDGTAAYIEGGDSKGVKLRVNGTTDAVTITSAGDVGIGTSPGRALHISSGSPYIRLHDSDVSSTIYAEFAATVSGGFYFNADPGDAGSSTRYEFFIGGVEVMRIATTGVEVYGSITQKPLSADPADPAEGYSVTWVSDGTDSGDAGDVMMKINVGGVTKTVTLVDYSAAP